MVAVTINADASNAAASKTAALTAGGKPKEKRRNNEKRKEKSRDAARCRRSRETEIFTELAQVLPLKKEDVNQLDKASVMRVAIAYLRVRDMLQLFPKIQELTGELPIDTDSDSSSDAIAPSKDGESFDLLKSAEASQLIKETMDGFLIVLSNDGDITYVSDNVNEYLGIAKIDILGQQIWEYSHQCDHAELKEALNIKRNGLADKVKDENLLEEGLSTDHRELFVRFKCTLTSRGRSINIKSASYKVIHITGHLVVNTKGDRVLVAIGRPIPHPSNIEIPLGTTTFLTKHALDMKFTYVDDKMSSLFGYKPEDLTDVSLFGCHHGGDSDSLMATFKTVLSKGQGETCRYRFLGKYGGYCWIVTQATIVYDKLKPQSVVCVNYVISNLENNNEIYSLAQYEASQQKLEANNNNNNCNDDKQQQHKSIETKEKSIEQESSITATAATIITNNNNNNINAEVEEVSIKTSPSPPQLPPPPLITLNDNKPNKVDHTDDNVDDHYNTIGAIKREKSPSIAGAAAPNITTSIPTSPLIAIIPPKLIDIKPLSPLPIRNLQSNFVQSPPQIIEKKLPKSVTASVFRTAPIAAAASHSIGSNNELPSSISHHTGSNTNATITSSLLKSTQLPQLNAAPRAQSVTASVFTPISQLPTKQQKHIAKNTTATAAIFGQQQQQQAPSHQHQDMNKGFLSFTEDATELTMLKEEPDDLAHLAPTPLFNEMLVGLIGSYGGFLGADDINSLDSTTSSSAEHTATTAAVTRTAGGAGVAQNCNSNGNYGNNSNGNNNNNSNVNSNTTTSTATTVHNNTSRSNNKGGLIDPFINYREESNDTNCSQHLLSPSVPSKSPEASSLPSLCSPNSISQEDEFAFMTMSVDDDIDLTMRAPYIPMNEQDDLPLLTADDLMWCGSHAFSAEDLQIHKDADAMQQLQMQQQQLYENNRNIMGYQQQQQQLNQHQFSNSLCSSPASTVSSLSPSPVNHHQQHHQQQQQHHTATVFGTDSSELAALLCGSGNGTLSILGNSCGGSEDIDGGGNSGIGSIGSAALSPVHHHQQQQQQQQQRHCTAGGGDFRLQQLHEQDQQQQLLGLSIDCKKEKFDSPSLCDSIEDAFEHVYSKDSTNLDCWNELLQINVNDTSSPTPSTCSPQTTLASQQQQLEELRQQQQQQQDCKQHLQLQQLSPQQQQENTILNAVPLITIQNNKNIMLQQHLTQRLATSTPNNSNKMIINNELLSSTLANQRSGNNKVATIKLLAGGNVQAMPITTTATIRVVESKAPQRCLGQTATKATIIHTIGPQQQHGSKRHISNSTTATQVETKRLKSTTAANTSSATVERQASPQLLQQLITPTNLKERQQQQQQQQSKPQQQRKSNAANSTASQRWPNTSSSQIKSMASTANATQQQSNSVLKNLLMNGCDDVIQTKQEPLLLDENSLDQEPLSRQCVSPSLTNPLHCLTSTVSVLRNYRHNPMIGGPGVLPSPPFAHSDDSNPPGLMACDTDSASDSGIDDISINESSSPVKGQLETEKSVPIEPYFVSGASELNGVEQIADDSVQDMLLMKSSLNLGVVKNRIVAPPTPPPQAIVGDGSSSGNNKNRRKSSISFMDSGNPLLATPFLMDLCNDDYNMSSVEPLLDENDIEHVLSEWTHEMV